MSRKGYGNTKRYRYRKSVRPGGTWVNGPQSNAPNLRMRRVFSIGLAVALLGGMIAAIIFMVRSCSAGEEVLPTPTVAQEVTPTPFAPVVTPGPAQGLTEEDAIPLDGEAAVIDMPTKHQHVSSPVIYGSKMAYSAGSGSIRTNPSVLKDLYVYDFLTGEETLIASTQLSGEISEIQFNDNYLMWVDSDNYTKHSIWRYMLYIPTELSGEEGEYDYDETAPEEGEDANPEEPVDPATPSPTPSATPSVAGSLAPSPSPAQTSEDSQEVGIGDTVLAELRQIQQRKPRLKLYGDNLVYNMEDAEENNDQLYLINPRTGEDTSLAVITDPAAYGASPPYIYGSQVIWAMHDPEQPVEGRDPDEDEMSAIYYINIDKEHLSQYPVDPDTSYIIPDYWRAGMYVDKPQANDDVWIWTEAIGIGEKLWVRDLARPDADPYVIAENDPDSDGIINRITLIEGYIVYCKNETIYAYDYVKKLYYRLSPIGEINMIPAAGGKRVVWFPKTGDGEGDVLMSVILP